MTEEQRKRWDTRATGWMTGAINTPVGAAFYAYGGWWMVLALAVSSFALACGTIGWLVWSDTRHA